MNDVFFFQHCPLWDACPSTAWSQWSSHPAWRHRYVMFLIVLATASSRSSALISWTRIFPDLRHRRVTLCHTTRWRLSLRRTIGISSPAIFDHSLDTGHGVLWTTVRSYWYSSSNSWIVFLRDLRLIFERVQLMEYATVITIVFNLVNSYVLTTVDTKTMCTPTQITWRVVFHLKTQYESVRLCGADARWILNVKSEFDKVVVDDANFMWHGRTRGYNFGSALRQGCVSFDDWMWCVLGWSATEHCIQVQHTHRELVTVNFWRVWDMKMCCVRKDAVCPNTKWCCVETSGHPTRRVQLVSSRRSDERWCIVRTHSSASVTFHPIHGVDFHFHPLSLSLRASFLDDQTVFRTCFRLWENLLVSWGF